MDTHILSNAVINIWQGDLNLSENITKICCYKFQMLQIIFQHIQKVVINFYCDT